LAQAKLDAERRNQEAEALAAQEAFEIDQGIKIRDLAKIAADKAAAEEINRKMLENGVTQAGLEELAGSGKKIDVAPTFNLELLGVDLEKWQPLVVGKLRCKDKYWLGQTDAEIQTLRQRQGIFHMDGRLYCNGRLPQNVPADDTSCDCSSADPYVLLVIFQSKPADKAMELVNLNVDHFNPKVRDFQITLVIPFGEYSPVISPPQPKLPHVRSCEHDIDWWKVHRIERSLASARFLVFAQGEISTALYRPGPSDADMGMEGDCNNGIVKNKLTPKDVYTPGTDCECYLPKRYRKVSGCDEHFNDDGISGYLLEQLELRTAEKCYQDSMKFGL